MKIAHLRSRNVGAGAWLLVSVAAFTAGCATTAPMAPPAGPNPRVVERDLSGDGAAQRGERIPGASPFSNR